MPVALTRARQQISEPPIPQVHAVDTTENRHVARRCCFPSSARSSAWFLSEIRAVRRSLQGRRPSFTVRASARRRVRRAATGGRVQEVVALNWLAEVRSRMDPRTAGRTRD
jgi:hypothetical protein